MYRDPSWAEGHYIDRHKKFHCYICRKDFIVGEKLLEDCPFVFPICPYCGRIQAECVVETADDQLEELADQLGCLAIYVNEEK